MENNDENSGGSNKYGKFGKIKALKEREKAMKNVVSKRKKDHPGCFSGSTE